MSFRSGLIAIAATLAVAGTGVAYGQAQGRGRGGGPFAAIDQNNDGVITLGEWDDAFRRADRNGDGVLSRDEMPSLGISPQQSAVKQSAAFRAGYERGLNEGRAAGREDKQRNQGFDLEGQRELQTADSGYTPDVGAKADYQAGYREGFRRGYKEGWGPR